MEEWILLFQVYSIAMPELRTTGGRSTRRYTPHFEKSGRPTQLDRMIELAKMSWSPVLEMLGREIRFEELAAYPFY
jgi:hypothetical protein